jgi:4'-phosphopantetheinyl transferase
MHAYDAQRQLANDQLELLEGDVHVWRMWLEVPTNQVHALGTLLSADELSRATRFVFAEDRRRFLAARAALRSILGRYIGCNPELVKFSYTSTGKPELAAGLGELELRFNVSHSHVLAVVALTRKRAIGIDIEHLSRDDYDFDVAEQYFSKEALEHLASVDPVQRIRVFLDYWTRNEALAKATGEGLGGRSADVTYSRALSDQATRLYIDDDSDAFSGWQLLALEPAVGYTGALAVQGKITRLKWFEWPAVP